MNRCILFARAIFIACLFQSCSASLPVSKYARNNKFNYQKEQPTFHYGNEKLKISGNWWWASGSRAIPKVKYLPDSIKEVLAPYTKSHGPVLFTTFIPTVKKFHVSEEIKVTKEDVRRKHNFILPFYETVLVSTKPFSPKSDAYWAVNSNSSFSIYARKSINNRNGFRTLEVIASEPTRYYTFICIMDKAYIKDTEDSAYQVSQFVSDVHERFMKRN